MAALADSEPMEGVNIDLGRHLAFVGFSLHHYPVSHHATARPKGMQDVVHVTHVCKALRFRYRTYQIRQQVLAVSLQGGGRR